jgi:hypothetical protein
MSINNISYLEQVYPSGNFVMQDPKIYELIFLDAIAITEFLAQLEYIFSSLLYEEDQPVVI